MAAPQSTAVKWGILGGVLAFMASAGIVLMASENPEMATLGSLSIFVASLMVVATLVGKWWERGWNVRIADAEAKRVDIEERRLDIEAKRVDIEERRLDIELIKALAALAPLLNLLPKERRDRVVEELIRMCVRRITGTTIGGNIG